MATSRQYYHHRAEKYEGDCSTSIYMSLDFTVKWPTLLSVPVARGSDLDSESGYFDREFL